MDKPFFRLVGAPCGQHGQYTFYKALRVTGKRERIIAIGDFFFIRIWQDSELVSIGELQLLWTDRVSDQTLVSLRLYFLPENTPDGRHQHGEHEVLAINDKVVVRAEDLMSWMCEGEEWRWGLRAVWRGSCAPPTDAKSTQPLHHTKLDFSDVEKERNSIASDADSPGVVVFSYPRYCRYRALVARLEGIQADWLRDSLVAALGGYSAPSNNTRILYCKDTFEYPELEGHEFVCNHLAPRLKGRPRGRRRRAPRSRSRSRSSRSTDSDRGFQHHSDPDTPRRLSLRNGASGKHSEEEDPAEKKPDETAEDKAFLVTLKQFYKHRGEAFKGHSLKDCSLRWLYWSVVSRGGYGAVCRRRLWSTLCAHSPTAARNLYERFLLPYENHERRKGSILKFNGKVEPQEQQPIDTIEVSDSPLREVETRPDLPEKRLRTPSPRVEPKPNIDNETGEFKEDVLTKSAEVLNREFLESLPKEEDKTVKISVKSVEKLLEAKDPMENTTQPGGKPALVNNDTTSYFTDLAYKFNLESRDALRSQRDMCSVIPAHALGTARPAAVPPLNGYSAPRPPSRPAAPPATTEQVPTSTHRIVTAVGSAVGTAVGPAVGSAARPLGRSSLRAVRVKPARPHHTMHHNTSPAPPLRPDSASSSPPTATSLGPAATPLGPAPVLLSVPQPMNMGITNFGIHRPPQQTRNHHSDDEIVEVPYRPKSPEIIDLDEYEEGCGRNEHSAKKKKLELLKERGLEVTAIPYAGWSAGAVPPHPAALPPLHRQLFARAQLLQLYGYGPSPPPPPPPRAAQAACPFGSAGATKTVYCDPRAPLMPAPHVILGAPPRPAPAAPPSPAASPVRALDLTRPSPPPAPPKVEITLVNKWKGGGGNGSSLEPYAALYGRVGAYRQQLAGQRDKR